MSNNILSLSALAVIFYQKLLLLHFPVWYTARFRQQHTSSPTLFAAFMNEWKLVIATSAFLLASDLGILQLPGVMSDRPIRTFVFMSIAFASFSILFSVILIFYFSAGQSISPRSHVLSTILNTENERCFWWNSSILVALPVIWASWSAIYFAVVLLLLLWYIRVEVPTGIIFRDLAQRNFTDAVEYMPSVAATVVLVVSGVYLVLVIYTLRSWIVHGSA